MDHANNHDHLNTWGHYFSNLGIAEISMLVLACSMALATGIFIAATMPLGVGRPRNDYWSDGMPSDGPDSPSSNG